jgi:predicted glycogen debranching enzyme
LDETLVLDGARYELGVNQFPGALHPRGHEWLAAFTAEPFPTWKYRVAGGELRKQLFLVDRQNTAVVTYTWKGPARAQLEVRPLVAFRDYHALQRESAAYRGGFRALGGDVLEIQPYENQPPVFVGHNAELVTPTGHWYRRFEYARERERGLDFAEDLHQPFVLGFALGERAELVVSTEPRPSTQAAELEAAEQERRLALTEPLARAAAQFFATRVESATVVAGYPWFTDWGRDTMIALPGLLRATGYRARAREILANFARFTSEGMLPNWFPERGQTAEYNTIDASLWFFEAAQEYFDLTGDAPFVERELYPVMVNMVRWHLRGTRYGIGVDRDGLLQGGAEGVQLTWMDAKAGDWVVTPRRGKPVEIQALWYNALRITETLAGRTGDTVTRIRCGELADWAVRHFEPLFWNRDAECLFDVVEGEVRDASIRPNQVLAASLTHPLITGDRARRLLAVVERDLLTPMGLRTLSPRDLRYQRVYEGGVRERDAAYHQGTVWPWLMGPFAKAYLRSHPGGGAQVAAWLRPLEDHLAAHGQLPEIADGEAPHHARGCPAQAWSVAALADLRALLDNR